MGSDLFQLDGDTFKIVGVSISALLIVGFLANKLISSILQHSRDNHLAFKSAYVEFAKEFTATIQQLETGDSTLNALILSDFPSQDLAMRNFIDHLYIFRKRRFLAKWRKYEQKYYEIKSLGVFGVACAIAPSEEDLKNVTTPKDMERWELNRRKELHTIIRDCLAIAKRKWP